MGEIKTFGSVTLIHGDCMEFMEGLGDKAFGLAVCDVNYGIGVNKMALGNGKNKIYRGKNDWDKESPKKEYFDKLLNISENQILWGANHFISKIPFDSSCWIFWDKGTGNNDYADGELAWTSFNSTVKKFYKSWVGANAKDTHTRIHPTQKPVALYEWLLKNYAKPNDIILDTHAGSFSSAVACLKMGFTYTGIEIDAYYFKAGCEWVEAVYEAMILGYAKTKLNKISPTLF